MPKLVPSAHRLVTIIAPPNDLERFIIDALLCTGAGAGLGTMALPGAGTGDWSGAGAGILIGAGTGTGVMIGAGTGAGVLTGAGVSGLG